MKREKLHNNAAFTLVELAIVIVIIGLIFGGVIGGQSLIKTGERRTALTGFEKYITAIQAFKLEYSQLPGDFNEAWDFIGTHHVHQQKYAATAIMMG